MLRMLVAALSIVAASASIPVSAATLTYVGDVPPQTTDLNTLVPNLFRFDPSLGTLLSVEVSLATSVTTEFSLTNNATVPNTALVQTLLDVNLESTDPGIDGLLGALTSNLSVSTGRLVYAVGETKKIGPLSDSDSSTKLFTAAGDLALFLGTGALDFRLTTLTTTNTSGGGGNLQVVQTSLAGGQVVISYNYEPAAIPEPSSIVMLGLAGVGVAGFSARRARRSRS